MDARLDAMTRQKVEDLATRFHQPRAAVLCCIMHWAISRRPREEIDQGDADGPVRHLFPEGVSDLLICYTS
jgi:N-acyl-L-homoserine lactone synthetase